MYSFSRCFGWWEQYGIREAMEGLIMSVDQHVITGSGYDIVGMFTFAGNLDETLKVQMVKQYLGRHNVLYEGQFDGKDLMQGIWKVDGVQGAWEIRFREEEANRRQKKQRERLVLPTKTTLN